MQNTSTTPDDFLSIIVRLLGLVMLIIGLYVGIKVIFEAWELYEQPERIERFADAIDRGSNLDSVIQSLTSNKLNVKPSKSTEDLPTVTKEASIAPKVSYFLAWFLAILLLMVIGGLASSAIRTGGQLALYDLQVKRFARQLIKEARKTADNN